MMIPLNRETSGTIHHTSFRGRYCSLHEVRTLVVDVAELLHLGRPHVAFDQHVWLAQRCKQCDLDCPGRLYTVTDGRRRLAAVQAGQLLEGHTPHGQVDVVRVSGRKAPCNP